MAWFFRRGRVGGARAKAAYTPGAVLPLEGRALLSAEISRFPLPNGTGVGELAAGPDGKVWFSQVRDFGSSAPLSLGRLGTSGKVDRIPLPARVQGVGALSVGSDGNMWFGGSESKATGGYEGVIGRVTPRGAVTLFDVPEVGSVDRLARRPGGNLVFAASTPVGFSSNIEVGRVSTSGAVNLWPLSFSNVTTNSFFDGSGARGLAVDGAGDVWVGFDQETSLGIPDGKLARIAPDGRLDVYTLPVLPPTSIAGQPTLPNPYLPLGMTTGPDGNVWVTEATEGAPYGFRVVRVTPRGAFTRFPVSSSGEPDEIVSGPGGKLYFSVRDTDSDVPGPQNELGVITRGGRVSILSLPYGGPLTGPSQSNISADGALTVGPDGNVYFVNMPYGPPIAGEIGRLNLRPALRR